MTPTTWQVVLENRSDGSRVSVYPRGADDSGDAADRAREMGHPTYGRLPARQWRVVKARRV